MHPDLKALKNAYSCGQNITSMLRKEGVNTIEGIEYAYDLQAGSYVRGVLDAPEKFASYTAEIGKILAAHVRSLDTLLDCGSGELTTLSAVSHYLPDDIGLYAFDLSVSRIMVGKRFAKRAMSANLAANLQCFVAAMDKVPLDDHSVDVLMTSHALEPNHGREDKLLKELFRVCRRKLLLFEPSWELNSAEGRSRMESLGYIRDLPEHIKESGGILSDVILLKNIVNPLNPTACYIIDVPTKTERSIDPCSFVCPISGERLTRYDGYYWSDEGGYAYPEIEEVPILRESNAVLMCHR